MAQRVMLITGASTGIGRATALAAAESGFAVCIGARTETKLEQLATELGADALARTCDVTDPMSVEGFVKAAVDRFGKIDVVFANAGIGGQPGGFSSAPPQSWNDLLMTNVFGLALTLQAVTAQLRKNRGHAVINSSAASRRSIAGSMYSASKWAATGIGHGFRKELEGSGVRVTIIEPGIVDTPFFDDPKPGMLQPEDVARAVLYAVDQPEHVEVHELTILPTRQSQDVVP